MRNDSSKILFGGDLVITENHSYNTTDIDSKLVEIFNDSDLNIVNLEAPVTKSKSKIIKTGPHLKSNEDSTLNVLKSLDVDVVTLANNHVLDYDEKGIEDTIAFCDAHKIKYLGAGMNLKDASKTLFLDSNAGKIAIINFAENEWASATENTAGAHPVNIIDNFKQIRDAKTKADFVFVIIHGGHEYYNLPSPRMQKQYRFYAEQGADLIIGHHTHCVSGYEIFNGTPIYYGIGNMLFTYNSNYPDWYEGIILEVEINKNKALNINLHPITQDKSSFGLRLMQGDDKQIFLNRISKYSKIINDEKLLQTSWADFSAKESSTYLGLLSLKAFVKNKYIRGVLSKLGVTFNNDYGNSLLLNMLRCESHRDLSIDVSEKYLKRKMSNFKK